MNDLHRLRLIVVLGVVAIVGCSRSDSDQRAQGGAAKAPSAPETPKTEPANPVAQQMPPVAAGDAAAQPALGKGAIVDPASNLSGDPMRTFMDILEVTIRADGDNFVLEALTAAPFPSPSEMAGGKRFDFMWFIDIDKNRKTGQGDGGNDYNIHLFLAESGWDAAWYKVSSIGENDGINIQPEKFKIHVEGRRASLAFPKEYLPSKSFEMWSSASTGDKWPTRTENPHTPRGVFDF